jgi:hypothetical protein
MWKKQELTPEEQVAKSLKTLVNIGLSVAQYHLYDPLYRTTDERNVKD